MANPEHIAILKKGVGVWNRWRKDCFARARADFYSVERADLSNADLHEGKFSRADFRLANLNRTNLSEASLRHADLDSAKVDYADLRYADLRNAYLRAASFNYADLSDARLDGAVLHGAYFCYTNLSRTTLSQADLSMVTFVETVLANTNLNHVRGLHDCTHLGPSYLDHRTIARSGSLPLVFIRGCGLPDRLIDYLPSLLDQAIQFFSCFISYSAKDQAFADRLHADLQNAAVRCWFAPEDLKIGDPFRQRIDESIRLHDKLLLILSEHSVGSPWVRDEVEAALERERRENRLVLFPIRIDDAVMETDQAWAASIRRTRHIGDFSNWKNHDSYQAAFQRLLRDLKADTKAADTA
jgi:uncharacterized protein YjbI with pentapeptide repeats